MIRSSFGDPSCWAIWPEELSFVKCCSVALHGPEGNDLCWRGEWETTFERCCLGAGTDPEQHWSRTMETLRNASEDFHFAAESLARIVHRVDIERTMLAGRRALHPWEAEELAGLGDIVRQWRQLQLAEVAAKLDEVLETYRRDHRRHGAGRDSPRIAILLACTPDSVGSDVCRLGAGLWQCYAQHHGYHFIFDTTPFAASPTEPRFRFAGGAPFDLEALDADFGTGYLSMLEEEPLSQMLGTDGAAFKWWQRWYAARRHLQEYDLLLVVDPDTAVFPSCMGVDLPTALGLPADFAAWPGIIARDPREGEDLNGGVFALTGSPWGRLYLELLLARSRWPIDVAGGGGWCHARQSAEYETLLEIIALDQMVASGGALEYSSGCMKHAVPQVVHSRGWQGVPQLGCIWPEYLKCWRGAAARLLGPQGARSERGGGGARLLDPAKSDINYRPWSNEPRYRRAFRDAPDLPAVRNPAFLWHYVGVPDKAASLMRDFGLSSFQETYDCRNLTRRWVGPDREGGPRSPGRQPLPPCTLAGSPVACPFEDSDLMPRQFGC